MKFQDLTGQFFNDWEVIQRAISNNSSNHIMWVCFCKCGKAKEVSGSDLKSGKSKNCGCKSIEKFIKRNITHGKTGSPEFTCYYRMKQRCYNPNTPNYSYYGGRGITVCNRWLESFENFLEDMGERPEGTSIERKDNNKGYCPENCVWATKKEQARNRRSNVLITLGGKTKCLQSWLEDKLVKRSTYSYRIMRGWSPEKSLNSPINNNY